MTSSISRRNLLKGISATVALAALDASALCNFSPTKRWRVALIGTGWYGKSDLFRLMQVANIEVIALCDPDKNQLEKAAQLVTRKLRNANKPLLYEDYRLLLTENKLDIVLIGSPDHWHALQAIEAMKAGAHVYVQKPISVDVIEGEAMVAAARKYNRVVQVGTQRRSTPHFIEAKKNIIEKGLLGTISHVEMCCYYHMRANGNPPEQKIPDYFNYDLWTGPAPLRPYDGLPHTRWWRTFMEYGNGIMGDMCVHMFDATRWMLGLGWPRRISSSGGIFVDKEGKSNISDTQSAIFEFDQLNCYWQHRAWGTASDPDYPWALMIYGSKGTLKASTMRYDFIPVEGQGKIHRDVIYEKEKFPEDLKEEGIELHAAPATRQHLLDFIKAIESNGKPVSDILEGHISTASCILANLSMKLGRPLQYDPSTKSVINDPEATSLLARPYRGPWIHPLP